MMTTKEAATKEERCTISAPKHARHCQQYMSRPLHHCVVLYCIGVDSAIFELSAFVFKYEKQKSRLEFSMSLSVQPPLVLSSACCVFKKPF